MTPLKIFLHVPRTAGTTVVRHIEKNYSENERLSLYPESLGILSGKRVKYSSLDYKRLVKKYISGMKAQELRKIKVIYGHYVPFGIEKQFARKAVYITVFRDPIKRSESLYNFWATSYFNDSPKNRLNKIYNHGFLVNGKVESYCKWLLKNFTQDNYANFSVSLEKYLSGLGYKDLKSFKFIGLTERSNQDFPYIYFLLNINKFYPNLNKSKRYVKQNHYCDVVQIINDNSKDFTIYKKVLEKNKPADFLKRVSQTKIKRLFSKALLRDIYYFFLRQ